MRTARTPLVRKGARTAQKPLAEPRTTPLFLKGVVVVRGAFRGGGRGAEIRLRTLMPHFSLPAFGSFRIRCARANASFASSPGIPNFRRTRASTSLTSSSAGRCAH